MKTFRGNFYFRYPLEERVFTALDTLKTVSFSYFAAFCSF